MREFKFRGRDGDDWYYGSLFVNECGHTAISAPKSFWMKPVNAETVGQFTGLHDANGREIYEGDVLEYKTWAETGERYVTMGDVRFLQGQFLVVGPKDIEVQGLFSVAHEPALSDVLVVGNVHDNLNLLEADDARD